MRLVFIGADHEVTGSCHYMEVGDKKIVVDIGMEQGQHMFENQEIPVNASELDYVLLTHAHIDHTGLLPLLYARGFRGQVYATKATCDLAQIMLRDSAHNVLLHPHYNTPVHLTFLKSINIPATP